MTVTRDSEYPAEMAQLMEAFSHCADGHTGRVVLNAALQMLSASIGFVATSSDFTRADLEKYTTHISALLLESVLENWKRKGSPTDVPVRLT